MLIFFFFFTVIPLLIDLTTFQLMCVSILLQGINIGVSMRLSGMLVNGYVLYPIELFHTLSSPIFPRQQLDSIFDLPYSFQPQYTVDEDM